MNQITERSGVSLNRVRDTEVSNADYMFKVQRGRKSKNIRISANLTLDDLDNEIKGVYNYQ